MQYLQIQYTGADILLYEYKIMGKLEKKLLKKMSLAIKDFWMIDEWEIILLWVSGWKDSMALWYLLSEMRKYAKEKFEIRAVYIFKDFLIDCDINFEEKRKYFEEELHIPLEKIDIKLPEDSKLNDGIWQSCQWCAYARRVAMFNLCEKRGAKKICMGHHMDDIVVTTMMNMIEWRKLQIMAPINAMSKMNITFIRPMAYLREKDIMTLVKQNGIPYSPCNCPVWEDTMRNKIKYWIVRENEKNFPKYTENMFWALIKDFREKYEHKWYKT